MTILHHSYSTNGVRPLIDRLMAAWGGSMMPQNEAKHLKALDIVGAVREDFIKSYSIKS